MSLKQIISSALVGVGLAYAVGCGDEVNNYYGEDGNNRNGEEYDCETAARFHDTCDDKIGDDYESSYNDCINEPWDEEFIICASQYCGSELEDCTDQSRQ